MTEALRKPDVLVNSFASPMRTKALRSSGWKTMTSASEANDKKFV